MNCNKCCSPSTVILRKKDHYCNDCFLMGTNHKFRATIGKNKILSKNDKVLVCTSGGLGSTALIDLVHNGINLDIHKKLRIIPFILHITGQYNYDTDIIKQCERYNFSVYCVPISEYMNPNKELPNTNSVSCENPEYKEEFNTILKTLPATACNDFMDQVKRSLFISYAKLLDCKYVFTAETASSLATKLLSNLAIGRGSQVQNNIGFLDQRDETKIIRPMKDISKEELDHYICIKQLKPIQHTDIKSNSLQTIISCFVSDLQENFQSTISTVCKTADKIGSTSNNDDIGRQCSICQSSLMKMETKISALEATNISKSVSFGRSLQETNISNNMYPLIGEHLCYSCSKNYSDIKKCNLPHIQKLIQNL